MFRRETLRTRIESAQPQDADLLLEYYVQNRTHLAPWDPVRSDEYYTTSWWHQHLQESQQLWQQGAAWRLVAFTPDRSSVLGICNFSNVVRGVFQACHVGYSIAQQYQGQGLMAEILRPCLDWVFDEQDLHRVMANYLPENHRSAALLQRLGFEQEGLARSYLQIAGTWRDHVLTSCLNPRHVAQSQSLT